ncbi:helix-turn-helix domain-containing protein [Salegentibacter sp. LM13S]|uniref:helix-turn-helix domain-containing protein n=1 Tax=Salegentibacter lacus TaxID=2873599 RepID=UPI001CCFA096|nr:helix-turn-helix domain-containing protein [Salegentibacter lacus]MBZ9629766.1 helix-turn-helix domain-containing protein [Salegentibacter lacus]
MATSIITTEDLASFKKELLGEIKVLLQEQGKFSSKKYLKSTDVMKMLKISPGTLQNLRVNGTLPYSKIGGLIFYEADKIAAVLEENKVEF